jgi:hypothetical protein
VISQQLAAHLSLSVGDAVTSVHQHPNGAATRHRYTITSIASVRTGFSLSMFVVEPVDTPCASRRLLALPSFTCSVLLNSPQGAAIGAVQPLPDGMSLDEGQVGLAAGLAERLSLQLDDPVVLTPPQVDSHITRVQAIPALDDKIANNSTVYLPAGLVLPSCLSFPR